MGNRLHDPNDVPRQAEYSTRGPGDFVISGPLWPNRGIGRAFMRAEHALQWAVRKYGDRVYLLPESLKEGVTRWAILVKPRRS